MLCLAADEFPTHVGDMRKTIICSAITLLACIAPASAQMPGTTPPSDGTDRAFLSACLREQQANPRSCIGSIAVPCVQRAATTGRAEAEISCAKRETNLWRERLDAASGVYAQSLDASQRSRFSALQRNWEGYIAQKCAFAADTQAPARMAAMQSGCDLREVAGRSLEIEQGLRGRQGTASNRRNQPPRIER